MDHFQVLGIARTASDADVRAAYDRATARLRPDQLAAASPKERERMIESMNAVHAAWRALRDPVSRAAYASHLSSPLPPPQVSAVLRHEAAASGMLNACSVCGCVPAANFRFRTQIGMVFARRWRRLDFVACRSCARSRGRSFQNLTLLLGWWGLLSFFYNFAFIAGNASELRRARRLGAPTSTAPGPTPRRATLKPGLPVVLRPSLLLIALATGALVVASIEGKVPYSHVFSSPSWDTGNCVQKDVSTGLDRVVWCSDTHDGKIVAVVGSISSCPTGATRYAQKAGETYCIKNDT